MIANKKLFFRGSLLLAAFLAVLFTMFMPIFDGKNALNYMDNLYNSISKGSAYYIPGLIKDNEAYKGKTIQVDVTLATERQAQETALLLKKAGVEVNQNGAGLAINGDLGTILGSCLADSDVMFNNHGNQLREKYSYAERQVIFNWWTALSKISKSLTKQNQFKEAKFIGNINQRAVECAFNYYEITPEKISNKIGIVVFSLAFYVIYTLWFGFAIMFMFEGWGMRLEH